jgi:hypothetical protein
LWRAHADAFRRGRRINSPPQFGQSKAIVAARLAQNVHSYEQMNASPSCASAVLHFSHCARISRGIALPVLSVPSKLSCFVCSQILTLLDVP